MSQQLTASDPEPLVALLLQEQEKSGVNKEFPLVESQSLMEQHPLAGSDTVTWAGSGAASGLSQCWGLTPWPKCSFLPSCLPPQWPSCSCSLVCRCEQGVLLQSALLPSEGRSLWVLIAGAGCKARWGGQGVAGGVQPSQASQHRVPGTHWRGAPCHSRDESSTGTLSCPGSCLCRG